MRIPCRDMISPSFPWVMLKVNKTFLLPLSQLKKDLQRGWSLGWLRGNWKL